MNKPIKQTLLGVLKKLNYYELITRTLVFGLIIAFLRLDNKLNEEETYVFWCVLVFLIMMYLTFSGKLFIKEPQPEPKEEEPTNEPYFYDYNLDVNIKKDLDLEIQQYFRNILEKVIQETSWEDNYQKESLVKERLYQSLRNKGYQFSFDKLKDKIFEYYRDSAMQAIQSITVENVKFWQEVCTEAAKHSTNPEEIADRALQAKIKAFGLIKETVKNRFACSIQEVIA